MRSTTAFFATLALLAAATPIAAQQPAFEDDSSWLARCRDGWGDRERGHACDVRAVPVKLSGRSIEVDGRQNGSVRVMGWDGDGVRVTARVMANADDEASARTMLSGVRVIADGRSVHAEGPSYGDVPGGWTVNYVLYVPRHFDLDLTARNGSLGVDGVSGRIELQTTNGSVSLIGTGGDVHARTQNGSLRVALAGTKWEGAGLDAETRNGSVRISVPDKYAATLETGTVNGRISTDIPVTLQGRIERRLTIPLNGGGTRLRAMTTNGAVSIMTP